MKKKRIIIVICSLVLLLLIGFIIFKLVTKTNERQLNKNLELLGKNFYKEYYKSQSDSQDDVKEFLKKFEKSGITITLENIASLYKDGKNKDLLNSMINNKTNGQCDFTKTSITIYPKKPYGENDYTIKTNLVCGFEK